jgi:hypothetical protein
VKRKMSDVNNEEIKINFCDFPEKPNGSFRVMSYNIKYESKRDGKNAWKHRKE